jgi:hypothetical protein
MTVGYFFQLQIMTLNIRPILAIDLTSTPNSRDPFVQFAGLTVFPLVTAFISNFFYYWQHRFQYAPPAILAPTFGASFNPGIEYCNDYHHWFKVFSI